MYGRILRDRRLLSGIRVLIHVVPTPDVGIGIFTPFGYMFEGKNEHGVTHLTEHTIFRSNRFYAYPAINRLMKRYGERGRFHAETHSAYAMYYARVLARDFTPAWDLLSSMVFSSNFPKYAIEREKRIVIKELSALEDDPPFLATRALMQSLFPTHPARNDFFEILETTKKIDRATILSRYREFNKPSRALVVVVGDVDPVKVLAAIEKLVDEKEETAYELPVFEEQKDPLRHKIRICKNSIDNAFVVFGFRAPSIRDKDFAAMRVLEYILVEGFDSPLKQFVREQTGCAYHTPDEYDFSHCHGLFYLGALTSPREVPRVAQLTCRAIRYVQQSLTKSRFFLNKRAVLNGLEMMKGSVAERVKFLGESAILGGPFDRELVEKIKKTKHDEVVEAARTYLDLDRAVEVIVRPD